MRKALSPIDEEEPSSHLKRDLISLVREGVEHAERKEKRYMSRNRREAEAPTQTKALERLAYKTCQHLEPTEKVVGRKKKFKILWCKNCGLVLDMKEVK